MNKGNSKVKGTKRSSSTKAVTKPKVARKPKERYSTATKLEAGMQYIIDGRLSSVSKAMDIPKTTLHQWKQTGQWDDLIDSYRTEKADEHMNAYSLIIDQAQAKAIEGLNNLDASSLSVSDIKGLVVTGATATDKGLLLAGKPTNISAQSDTLESYTKLFHDIATKVQRDLSVVSTQEKGK